MTRYRRGTSQHAGHKFETREDALEDVVKYTSKNALKEDTLYNVQAIK